MDEREEQTSRQPGKDGDQQDHDLATRKHSGIVGCAGTQHEQDQGQQHENDLDVLAVDLLRKHEKFGKLVFDLDTSFGWICNKS